jgi:hypothetical protein
MTQNLTRSSQLRDQTATTKLSRRDFLAVTGATTVAAASKVPQANAFQATRPPDSMQLFRFAAAFHFGTTALSE